LTRRLILLNLALLAAAGLLVWQFRREWLEAKAREQAVLRYQVKPAPTPSLAPLPKPAPFEAAAFADVAQGNLFSRDRNPNVIVDPPTPPPPRPVPAFPVARGVMLWDGTPPTIVLSQRSGAEQKGYHIGETIGEWRIVSIDNKYVVFSWDGKEFKKRIDELMDRAPVEVASAAPAPSAAQSGRTGNVALGSANGMGAEMGAGIRACVAGDTAPAGTVRDGLKKVVSTSPFGTVYRWEPSK